MITDPIFNQQQDLSIRNNGIRKVAASAAPPNLTVEESSMIKKNFASSAPVKLYDVQGSISEHNFADRGMNVDTRA